MDVVQVARQLSSDCDDEQLVQLPAWRRLLGERAEDLAPQVLRNELGGEVAFWFKLLGGKPNA